MAENMLRRHGTVKSFFSATRPLVAGVVGTRSNRDGIGSLVTIRAAGRAPLQVNDGKFGYLAQSVMPLYFGLGTATQADSITVKWPTGKQQIVPGPLRSGSTVVVREQ
jgi:hypothetical protein